MLKRQCVHWWKQTCIHSVSKCCMFIWVWHFNRHPGEVVVGEKQCIPMVTRTFCFIMFNVFNIKHTRQKKISHLEKDSFLGKAIHEQWKWKALGSVLWDMEQKLLFFIFGSWQFILSFFLRLWIKCLLSSALFTLLNKVLLDLLSHVLSYSKNRSY